MKRVQEEQEEKRREPQGEKSTIHLQAEKSRSGVEVKQNYNKQVRKKIDNVGKREKFKDKTFNGKKTIKDPYTGDIIHSDMNAAARKYGVKNKTKHSSDVDHTNPLEKVYEKTQNNPFLDYEDIKRIANNEENYKVINSRTNRSKKGKSNTEYIDSQKGKLTESEKKAMKAEERKANRAIRADITKTTIKNAHSVGMDAAKSGAKVGAGISAAKNLKKVVTGEEDFSDAVLQVGLDTAKSAATSYGAGICTQIVEGTIKQAAVKTTSKQFANGLSKFASSGGPAKAVAVVLETGDSVIRYIKGDISSGQLVYELGEKGTGLAMSFMAGAEGAVLGAGAGAFIGGLIGSVLPGAGTAAGAVIGTKVGAVVGEIVGNLAGYMLGSEVYRRVASYVDAFGRSSEEYRRIENMYNMIEKQLEEYEEALRASLEQAHLNYCNEIMNGFVSMQNAIVDNDVTGINHSLQRVCHVFGCEIAFSTRDAFDAFMMDDSKVVRLGKR